MEFWQVIGMAGSYLIFISIILLGIYVLVLGIYVLLVFIYLFLPYRNQNIIDDIIERIKKYPSKLIKRNRRKFYYFKIKKIIKEIDDNPKFKKCFWDVEYEVKNWSIETIKKYKLG